MSEQLDLKIDLMKREIDALQVVVMGQRTPWYKSVSTILSIVALLFSFSTTLVSYLRSQSQDIQAARQELRGLLQRLATLPRENMEITKKYADDPTAAAMVSALINQESTVLIRQAAELAKRLPKNIVSSVEYYSVGVALQNAYDLAGAEEFLRYAAETAKDFNTEIAALRGTAAVHYQRGRADAGRLEYQKARDIFAKYSEYDAFTKASTHIWTELGWAGSEANIGAADLVSQHVDNAKAILKDVPPGPGKNLLTAQVAQIESRFKLLGPASPQPAPSLVAGVQLTGVH